LICEGEKALGGIFGLGFGVIVVFCAALWLAGRWRAARAASLCPGCKRWHENTCSIPQRPEVTQCRLYAPHEPLGPIQPGEDGKTAIDWDWEDGV